MQSFGTIMLVLAMPLQLALSTKQVLLTPVARLARPPHSPPTGCSLCMAGDHWTLRWKLFLMAAKRQREEPGRAVDEAAAALGISTRHDAGSRDALLAKRAAQTAFHRRREDEDTGPALNDRVLLGGGAADDLAPRLAKRHEAPFGLFDDPRHPGCPRAIAEAGAGGAANIFPRL